MPENNMQKNDTDEFFYIYAHVVSTLLTTISSQNSVSDNYKRTVYIKTGIIINTVPFYIPFIIMSELP